MGITNPQVLSVEHFSIADCKSARTPDGKYINLLGYKYTELSLQEVKGVKEVKKYVLLLKKKHAKKTIDLTHQRP